MFSKENHFSNRIKAINTLTHSFEFGENNAELRDYLERIITTAHDKLTNKIKDEDIDFDIYEIVTSMISSDKPKLVDYLKEIDTSNLNDQHLNSFNSIISTVVSEIDNDIK